MSRASAALLYLYSSRNIAGCVLALLGLGAYFGGVINQWWLPICLGLYAAGALMLPGQTLLEVDSYRRDDGAHLAESVEYSALAAATKMHLRVFDKGSLLRETTITLAQGLRLATVISRPEVFKVSPVPMAPVNP